MDRGVILRVRTRRQKYRRARRMRRFYAQRLPKSCPKPTQAGQRIQIDTLSRQTLFPSLSDIAFPAEVLQK